MRRSVLLAAAASLFVSGTLVAQAAQPEAYRGDPLAQGVGENLRPVAHLAYKGGTDIEFTTIKGRDYAIAPAFKSAGGDGLRIIDITTPNRPKLVGFLPCATSQNDVQVRGDLMIMGVDYDANDDECYKQVRAEPTEGLFVISLKNPAKPKAIGFVPVPLGVHNATWHPGGRYVYVSDSELTPALDEPRLAKTGRIQIIDMINPRRPVQVGILELPLGLSSHDVTFNASGTRGYSAAITQTVILDTHFPALPRIITVIVDPAVNISHGADPTLDGRYLLVTDEQAGAAGNGVCNVGGVHVYDLLVEAAPVKVGYYPFNPANSLTATSNSGNLVCTAHVLDYAPDGTFFTNAGYAAGVRMVDATNLMGVPLELGYFTPVDADTWSAKTYKHKSYVFANDMVRGLDVYKYEPGGGTIDTRLNKDVVTFRAPTQLSAGSYCFTAARDAKAAERAA